MENDVGVCMLVSMCNVRVKQTSACWTNILDDHKAYII